METSPNVISIATSTIYQPDPAQPIPLIKLQEADLQKVLTLNGSPGNPVTTTVQGWAGSCIPTGTTENVMKDYYVISANINIDNGPGFTRDKGRKWFGMYLAKATVNFNPLTQPVITARSLPATDVNTVNYNSGTSWGISGSEGTFADDPTENFSGSLNFSKSKSYSVSDLNINNMSGPNSANWVMEIGNLPKKVRGSHDKLNWYLTDPPKISIDNFQMDFTIIWEGISSERKGDFFEFEIEIICEYRDRHIEHNKMHTDETGHSIPITIPVKLKYFDLKDLQNS